MKVKRWLIGPGMRINYKGKHLTIRIGNTYQHGLGIIWEHGLGGKICIYLIFLMIIYFFDEQKY